ncbi:MAG: hypothetical protein IKR18_09300, partial [Bacteroidaceae bacterium]|nr:hypothetical protein [Bacteroidaceae bacterium]
MKKLVFIYFTLLLLASCATSDEAFEQPPSTQDANEWLAEYQSPRTILMHCPGNEVAGSNGRNKRFDKEAMQTEHKAYASLLMSKGIEVIEVTDVLRKAPIDRLRAIAAELSANDVSTLSADQLIEHILCIPPMKGFYYTRDQSITTPRGHIVGKMKLSHRRFEPELIELCYATMNRHVAHRITGSDAVLEGGDYLPFRTISLIGLGLRTNQKAIDELLQADAFGHDTVVVVKDSLFNTLQMHLDTYF